MPIAGFLTGKVQPKYLVMTGFAIIALAMNNLTNIYGDVDYSWFVWARIHMTIGFPFLFLPITTASYIGLRPEQTNQASALINVARNLGGSIMVSFTQTMLANRTQYNQSRLAEHVTPSSDTYKATLAAAKNYFIQQGSSLAEATNQAIAWIGQALERQATFLAYKEIFFWFMIIALCTIPLALLLRPQDLKAPSAG
jgi:DHA2 family multidrug resistance protein